MLGRKSLVAVGDRARASGPAEVEADQDLVRVAGRLGRGRPFAEPRVADHEQFPARGVAADHVRAGGRQRCPGLPAGGRRGQHVGEGEGQLGQEVRIGLGEVEGHGAGAVVGGDAAGQVTGRGGLLARGGAADGLVVGRAGAAELEQALEGAGDVTGPDERAGRIADTRAQAERVGAPVVGGRGQRQREVRDQPGAVRPGHMVQRDEPVVGQAEELRRGHVVRGGRGRVDRVDVPGWVDGGERAAAVTRPGRVDGGPEAAARGGERAEVAAEAEPGDHVVPGSEPEQRAVLLVRDPDAAAGFSQRRRLAAEADGRRDGIAPRIHPGHGRVERIEHPQPGRGRRHGGGRVADANRARHRAGPGVDPGELSPSRRSPPRPRRPRRPGRSGSRPC